MANTELDKVAAYFDGVRTMAERADAAQPVAAVPLGPRVNLPYYTAAEQSAGEKLRAAAAAAIGRDPVGKTVLARLNGPDNKPALPSFLIEDQQPGVVAQYDFRRRAVVLDRSAVLDAVVETVPPRERSALRRSLSGRADLLAYLDKHPEAIATVVKAHDVVIVHELTHAWQDRRDTVFREMARGNLPDSQPLEYEEEAWKTKNLYLHSKLKNDPASVRMDDELKDYVLMGHGLKPWKTALFERLESDSPTRALQFQPLNSFVAGRIARVKGRAVVTSEEQRAKALDLQALTRAQKSLGEVETAHAARMKTLDGELGTAKPESYKALGTYYLVQALAAERATDRAAWLDQAERYAKAAGEKKLLEEIKKARESR
ncbi:MAG: hypothetical protein M0D55_16425 [Elusimicrobiota bacterium]|nr:MAG: hypothetical protein M0D55_16425 [Elusimicrobiota bacterium]